jgi:hypothetical protein
MPGTRGTAAAPAGRSPSSGRSWPSCPCRDSGTVGAARPAARGGCCGPRTGTSQASTSRRCGPGASITPPRGRMPWPPGSPRSLASTQGSRSCGGRAGSRTRRDPETWSGSTPRRPSQPRRSTRRRRTCRATPGCPAAPAPARAGGAAPRRGLSQVSLAQGLYVSTRPQRLFFPQIPARSASSWMIWLWSTKRLTSGP